MKREGAIGEGETAMAGGEAVHRTEPALAFPSPPLPPFSGISAASAAAAGSVGAVGKRGEEEEEEREGWGAATWSEGTGCTSALPPPPAPWNIAFHYPPRHTGVLPPTIRMNTTGTTIRRRRMDRRPEEVVEDEKEKGVWNTIDGGSASAPLPSTMVLDISFPAHPSSFCSSDSSFSLSPPLLSMPSPKNNHHLTTTAAVPITTTMGTGSVSSPTVLWNHTSMSTSSGSGSKAEGPDVPTTKGGRRSSSGGGIGGVGGSSTTTGLVSPPPPLCLPSTVAYPCVGEMERYAYPLPRPTTTTTFGLSSSPPLPSSSAVVPPVMTGQEEVGAKRLPTSSSSLVPLGSIPPPITSFSASFFGAATSTGSGVPVGTTFSSAPFTMEEKTTGVIADDGVSPSRIGGTKQGDESEERKVSKTSAGFSTMASTAVAAAFLARRQRQRRRSVGGTGGKPGSGAGAIIIPSACDIDPILEKGTCAAEYYFTPCENPPPSYLTATGAIRYFPSSSFSFSAYERRGRADQEEEEDTESEDEHEGQDEVDDAGTAVSHERAFREGSTGAGKRVRGVRRRRRSSMQWGASGSGISGSTRHRRRRRRTSEAKRVHHHRLGSKRGSREGMEHEEGGSRPPSRASTSGSRRGSFHRRSSYAEALHLLGRRASHSLLRVAPRHCHHLPPHDAATAHGGFSQGRGTSSSSLWSSSSQASSRSREARSGSYPGEATGSLPSRTGSFRTTGLTATSRRIPHDAMKPVPPRRKGSGEGGWWPLVSMGMNKGEVPFSAATAAASSPMTISTTSPISSSGEGVPARGLRGVLEDIFFLATGFSSLSSFMHLQRAGRVLCEHILQGACFTHPDVSPVVPRKLVVWWKEYLARENEGGRWKRRGEALLARSGAMTGMLDHRWPWKKKTLTSTRGGPGGGGDGRRPHTTTGGEEIVPTTKTSEREEWKDGAPPPPPSSSSPSGMAMECTFQTERRTRGKGTSTRIPTSSVKLECGIVMESLTERGGPTSSCVPPRGVTTTTSGSKGISSCGSPTTSYTFAFRPSGTTPSLLLPFPSPPPPPPSRGTESSLRRPGGGGRERCSMEGEEFLEELVHLDAAETDGALLASEGEHVMNTLLVPLRDDAAEGAAASPMSFLFSPSMRRRRRRRRRREQEQAAAEEALLREGAAGAGVGVDMSNASRGKFNVRESGSGSYGMGSKMGSVPPPLAGGKGGGATAGAAAGGKRKKDSSGETLPPPAVSRSKLKKSGEEVGGGEGGGNDAKKRKYNAVGGGAMKKGGKANLRASITAGGGVGSISGAGALLPSHSFSGRGSIASFSDSTTSTWSSFSLSFLSSSSSDSSSSSGSSCSSSCSCSSCEAAASSLLSPSQRGGGVASPLLPSLAATSSPKSQLRKSKEGREAKRVKEEGGGAVTAAGGGGMGSSATQRRSAEEGASLLPPPHHHHHSYRSRLEHRRSSRGGRRPSAHSHHHHHSSHGYGGMASTTSGCDPLQGAALGYSSSMASSSSRPCAHGGGGGALYAAAGTAGVRRRLRRRPPPRCEWKDVLSLRFIVQRYLRALRQLLYLTFRFQHRWGRLHSVELSTLMRWRREVLQTEVQLQDICDVFHTFDFRYQQISTLLPGMTPSEEMDRANHFHAEKTAFIGEEEREARRRMEQEEGDLMRRCRHVTSVNLSYNFGLQVIPAVPPACQVFIATNCNIDTFHASRGGPLGSPSPTTGRRTSAASSITTTTTAAAAGGMPPSTGAGPPPVAPISSASSCTATLAPPPVHPSLYVLSLANNAIQDLSFLASFPCLQVVDLSYNRLFDIDRVIAQLRSHPKLTTLSLAGNPITLLDHYRRRIASACPQLEVLDGQPIEPEERVALAIRGGGGRGAPTRLPMSSSGGGSSPGVTWTDLTMDGKKDSSPGFTGEGHPPLSSFHEEEDDEEEEEEDGLTVEEEASVTGAGPRIQPPAGSSGDVEVDSHGAMTRGESRPLSKKLRKPKGKRAHASGHPATIPLGLEVRAIRGLPALQHHPILCDLGGYQSLSTPLPPNLPSTTTTTTAMVMILLQYLAGLQRVHGVPPLLYSHMSGAGNASTSGSGIWLSSSNMAMSTTHAGHPTNPTTTTTTTTTTPTNNNNHTTPPFISPPMVASMTGSGNALSMEEEEQLRHRLLLFQAALEPLEPPPPSSMKLLGSVAGMMGPNGLFPLNSSSLSCASSPTAKGTRGITHGELPSSSSSASSPLQGAGMGGGASGGATTTTMNPSSTWMMGEGGVSGGGGGKGKGNKDAKRTMNTTVHPSSTLLPSTTSTPATPTGAGGLGGLVALWRSSGNGGDGSLPPLYQCQSYLVVRGHWGDVVRGGAPPFPDETLPNPRGVLGSKTTTTTAPLFSSTTTSSTYPSSHFFRGGEEEETKGSASMRTSTHRKGPSVVRVESPLSIGTYETSDVPPHGVVSLATAGTGRGGAGGVGKTCHRTPPPFWLSVSIPAIPLQGEAVSVPSPSARRGRGGGIGGGLGRGRGGGGRAGGHLTSPPSAFGSTAPPSPSSLSGVGTGTLRPGSPTTLTFPTPFPAPPYAAFPDTEDEEEPERGCGSRAEVALVEDLALRLRKPFYLYVEVEEEWKFSDAYLGELFGRSGIPNATWTPPPSHPYYGSASTSFSFSPPLPPPLLAVGATSGATVTEGQGIGERGGGGGGGVPGNLATTSTTTPTTTTMGGGGGGIGSNGGRLGSSGGGGGGSTRKGHEPSTASTRGSRRLGSGGGVGHRKGSTSSTLSLDKEVTPSLAPPPRAPAGSGGTVSRGKRKKGAGSGGGGTGGVEWIEDESGEEGPSLGVVPVGEKDRISLSTPALPLFPAPSSGIVSPGMGGGGVISPSSPGMVVGPATPAGGLMPSTGGEGMVVGGMGLTHHPSSSSGSLALGGSSVSPLPLEMHTGASAALRLDAPPDVIRKQFRVGAVKVDPSSLVLSSSSSSGARQGEVQMGPSGIVVYAADGETIVSLETAEGIANAAVATSFMTAGGGVSGNGSLNSSVRSMDPKGKFRSKAGGGGGKGKAAGGGTTGPRSGSSNPSRSTSHPGGEGGSGRRPRSRRSRDEEERGAGGKQKSGRGKEESGKSMTGSGRRGRSGSGVSVNSTNSSGGGGAVGRPGAPPPPLPVFPILPIQRQLYLSSLPLEQDETHLFTAKAELWTMQETLRRLLQAYLEALALYEEAKWREERGGGMLRIGGGATTGVLSASTPSFTTTTPLCSGSTTTSTAGGSSTPSMMWNNMSATTTMCHTASPSPTSHPHATPPPLTSPFIAQRMSGRGEEGEGHHHHPTNAMKSTRHGPLSPLASGNSSNGGGGGRAPSRRNPLTRRGPHRRAHGSGGHTPGSVVTVATTTTIGPSMASMEGSVETLAPMSVAGTAPFFSSSSCSTPTTRSPSSSFSHSFSYSTSPPSSPPPPSSFPPGTTSAAGAGELLPSRHYPVVVVVEEEDGGGNSSHYNAVKHPSGFPHLPSSSLSSTRLKGSKNGGGTRLWTAATLQDEVEHRYGRALRHAVQTLVLRHRILELQSAIRGGGGGGKEEKTGDGNRYDPKTRGGGGAGDTPATARAGATTTSSGGGGPAGGPSSRLRKGTLTTSPKGEGSGGGDSSKENMERMELYGGIRGNRAEGEAPALCVDVKLCLGHGVHPRHAEENALEKEREKQRLVLLEQQQQQQQAMMMMPNNMTGRGGGSGLAGTGGGGRMGRGGVRR